MKKGFFNKLSRIFGIIAETDKNSNSNDNPNDEQNHVDFISAYIHMEMEKVNKECELLKERCKRAERKNKIYMYVFIITFSILMKGFDNKEIGNVSSLIEIFTFISK